MLSKKLPYDVLLLALWLRTELKKANPFVVDPASLIGVKGTLHPLLAAELTKPRHARRNTAVNHPAVLVAEEAEVFSWDDVPSCSQPISPAQMRTWKSNPETLKDQIFVGVESRVIVTDALPSRKKQISNLAYLDLLGSVK